MTASFDICAEFVTYKCQVVLRVGVLRIKLYGAPQMPPRLVVVSGFLERAQELRARDGADPHRAPLMPGGIGAASQVLEAQDSDRAAARASDERSAPHTWIWGTGHHELPA